MAAFNYYELVEYLLALIGAPIVPFAGGLAMLLVFAIVFLALQYTLMYFVGEFIDVNAAINGVAGAVFGAMTGVMLAGVLAVSWLLMPGSAYSPNAPSENPTSSHAIWGVDDVVLATARFMANDRISGDQPFDPMYNYMRVRSYKYSKGESEQTGNVSNEPKIHVKSMSEHNADIKNAEKGD